MKVLFLATLVASFISCNAWADGFSYSMFKDQAQELAVTKDHATYIWDSIPFFLIENSSATKGEKLSRLQRKVQSSFGPVGAMDLIRRQRTVYANHFGTDPKQNRILNLFDLFLENKVGTLRPTSALEDFLMVMHLELNRKISVRTEYIAYILTKERRAKVYASFGLRQDGVAPALSSDLESILRNDLATGWKIRTHLHSHPFAWNGQEDCGGAVVPSTVDIFAFYSLRKTLGVQQMAVTNGLNTMTLSPSDLKHFPDSVFTWPPRM